MNSIKIKKGNTRMIAHRGLSGIETENTAAAFIAAANRSYYGIETDVHVTQDGEFIIIHDDSTDRISPTALDVENSTFDSVRRIAVYERGSKDTPAHLCLPTPEEYISICRRYEKLAVLELKNHMEPDAIARLIDRLANTGYLDHIIFISFDFENLLHVRRSAPGQACQYLISGPPSAVIDLLIEHHMDVDAQHNTLCESEIALCHQNGIRVNCWTVDDPARAEALVKMGIDYITSNILE